MTTDSAYERGRAVLREMYPNRDAGPQRWPDEIKDDWGRLLVEMYGTIWARDGLSRRTRSIITVAALTALHMPEELRTHAGGALHNGVSRRELCEIVMHAAGYSGFPKGVEGMRVLRDVFQSMPDIDPPGPAAGAQPALGSTDDLYERGMAFRRERFGQQGMPAGNAPEEIAEEWWRFLTGTAFGALWPRPGLALQDHSRVTLAVLQVLHLPVEFRLHLNRALGLGISRDDLCEQIMHLALYGGFPTAVEAMRAAREVFGQT
jgi:4-carboxymuconolactone decarboxylase